MRKRWAKVLVFTWQRIFWVCAFGALNHNFYSANVDFVFIFSFTLLHLNAIQCNTNRNKYCSYTLLFYSWSPLIKKWNIYKYKHKDLYWSHTVLLSWAPLINEYKIAPSLLPAAATAWSRFKNCTQHSWGCFCAPLSVITFIYICICNLHSVIF